MHGAHPEPRAGRAEIMKIQLLSDLHLNLHGYYRIEPTKAHVIVLAGDIHCGIKGVQWAARESQILGKPIIYVSGNHEFYDHDINELTDRLRKESERLGVIFLENDACFIDGVRFLGCTLWTDYSAWPHTSQEDVMNHCQKMMSDHRLISIDDRPFLPEDALSRSRESYQWLKSNLESPNNEAQKTVVITHHAPSIQCSNPSYDLSRLTAGFVSTYDDLVSEADLWLFGHTHACLDKYISGTRVVSNQRGYPYEKTYGFEHDKVIEIPPTRGHRR